MEVFHDELLHSIDGIVWESDVGKPGYTFVSRQAERILGYPIQDWLQQPGFWRSILHPEDHRFLTGEGYRSPAEKRDSQVEYRVRSARGDYIWVKDYIKVIYDSGIPVKMRGIMVDISERKKFEEELRQARAIAIEAANLKSDFLANMSHEIRTPLNAIIGMATMALDDAESADQRDSLATIKTAADSLLTIVNDILDFSKIEAGKLELELSDFSLLSLARNALEVAASSAYNKSITLSLVPEPGVPASARGDPGRLLQILLNLLSNAVKFTSPGGQVTLRIAPSPSAASEVRFEVIDTGEGIPEAARGKLFRPFSQADASTARRHGGTGLGLSICKRLVDLMGGGIGVESAAGKGSTFWISIPLAPAEDPVCEIPDAPENETPRKLRLLVAEDNAANQKVIRRFLEKLGCAIEIVADGLEAVAAYERGHFDLVFMDCQMPGMDGYEATRAIREIEKDHGRQRVPIVAFTAHAFPADRARCVDAGMDDYLCKPVGLRKLERTVASWTRGRENPALDLSMIRELEKLNEPGQPDLVAELLDHFERSGPEALAVIESALTHGQAETARRKAHQFKSTCRNIGAESLAAIFQELESSKDPGAAPGLLEKAKMEHRRVAARVRELRAERKSPA